MGIFRKKSKKDNRWKVLKDFDNMSDDEFLNQLPKLKKKSRVMSFFGTVFTVIFIIVIIIVLPYL